MSDPERRSILVVDDEPGVRRLVTEVLSAEGYQVTAAQDVPSAVDALEGSPFAAVVTDLRMPGPPGLALVEEVERLGLRTPVILMSGGLADLDAADPRVGRLAGVVAKPVLVPMLRTLIPALIDGSE